MPPYMVYVSLLIGLLTTIVVSLILSRKFAPLKLWRKLWIALSCIVCSLGGAIFGIVVASEVAVRAGWPPFIPGTLTPTRQYLYWMYSTEIFFVAMIMGAFILAMDHGQRLSAANRYHPRR